MLVLLLVLMLVLRMLLLLVRLLQQLLLLLHELSLLALLTTSAMAVPEASVAWVSVIVSEIYPTKSKKRSLHSILQPPCVRVRLPVLDKTWSHHTPHFRSRDTLPSLQAVPRY